MRPVPPATRDLTSLGFAVDVRARGDAAETTWMLWWFAEVPVVFHGVKPPKFKQGTRRREMRERKDGGRERKNRREHSKGRQGERDKSTVIIGNLNTPLMIEQKILQRRRRCEKSDIALNLIHNLNTLYRTRWSHSCQAVACVKQRQQVRASQPRPDITKTSTSL